MENHIKVFRVHRALSWFYGTLTALSLFVWGMVVEDGAPAGEIVGVFVILGFFLFMHLLIAKGAKKKSGWAKTGSVIIAIFMLFGFPIGTIIGIYLLINNSGWGSVSIQKET